MPRPSQNLTERKTITLTPALLRAIVDAAQPHETISQTIRRLLHLALEKHKKR